MEPLRGPFRNSEKFTKSRTVSKVGINVFRVDGNRRTSSRTARVASSRNWANWGWALSLLWRCKPLNSVCWSSYGNSLLKWTTLILQIEISDAVVVGEDDMGLSKVRVTSGGKFPLAQTIKRFFSQPQNRVPRLVAILVSLQPLLSCRLRGFSTASYK